MPSLGEIAALISATLRGDPAYTISGVASLESAGPADIAFLADRRYRRLLETTKAGAVILTQNDAKGYGGQALVVGNPYAAYARVMQAIYPPEPVAGGVHYTAQLDREVRIDPSARVDAYAVLERGAVVEAGVWIGAGVVVGADCIIGAATRIYPRVVLYPGTQVGPRCIIHAGAVIGADGFGFAEERGAYLKIPHRGAVRIGTDVEIGANSTIDRGVLNDTVVGDGVKIDNLVQIGHNVCVDAHTVIAGQTGVAGSAHIGRHCRIGGQVGINGHIEIADGVAITGKSMVTRSIHAPGIYSSGLPAQENLAWRRSVARVNGLEKLYRRVAALERATGGDGFASGEDEEEAP